jgi:dynactin 1
VARARAVKNELNATGGLRKQLESRETDIRELKMFLRGKQEELGELSVRKELIDKKLANMTKEHELTVETLKVNILYYYFS